MLIMPAALYERHSIRVLPALLLLAACSSSFACDQPRLLAPAEVEISERSPRFEWSAVADASHYLVRIESRVPEGRLLWSEEIRTEFTALVSPRPLTPDRATVRIEVTAVCKDNTQAKALQRLRVDSRQNCRIEGVPLLERREGRSVLVWQAAPQAQTYELRAHSATDGRPVMSIETKRAIGDLGGFPSGLWVLAVQPKCGSARGESRYVTAVLP